MHAALATAVVLLATAVSTAGQQPVKQAPGADAQKAFSALKTLAGSWEGVETSDPANPETGSGAHREVSLRVASSGNALVHEIRAPGTPGDTTTSQPTVTVVYVDGDRLMLTHYCDIGNRPRMAATASPDGTRIEFNFVDVSGSTANGLMHDAIFTIIDSNHHTEDWTWAMGDKSGIVHFDLTRTK